MSILNSKLVLAAAGCAIRLSPEASGLASRTRRRRGMNPGVFPSAIGTHVRVATLSGGATGRLTPTPRVEAGEEIIIARDKQPVAKLVPV
jgi:hypothetical protein